MYEKLLSIINNYNSLNDQLMDPETSTNISKITEISKKIKNIKQIYEIAKLYVQAYNNKKEADEILSTEKDADMRELAQTQKDESIESLYDLEQQAKIALLPKDENDDKNIYLEIRPAAGGDEAGLFASELLRSYMLYAQKQ